MIDGYKLIMSLNDWWYSSFGYEETEESKAIKKVIDEVEKYVEQADRLDRKTEPSGYNLQPLDKDINVRSNSSEKPNNLERSRE